MVTNNDKKPRPLASWASPLRWLHWMASNYYVVLLRACQNGQTFFYSVVVPAFNQPTEIPAG